MIQADDHQKHLKKGGGPWAKRIWAALPAVFLLGLIILVALLFARIQARHAALEAQKAAELKTAQPDVNVVALEVRPSAIVDRLSLPGLVQPWVDLKVLVEVNGQVRRLLVKEGV